MARSAFTAPCKLIPGADSASIRVAIRLTAMIQFVSRWVPALSRPAILVRTPATANRLRRPASWPRFSTILISLAVSFLSTLRAAGSSIHGPPGSARQHKVKDQKKKKRKRNSKKPLDVPHVRPLTSRNRASSPPALDCGRNQLTHFTDLLSFLADLHPPRPTQHHFPNDFVIISFVLQSTLTVQRFSRVSFGHIPPMLTISIPPPSPLYTGLARSSSVQILLLLPWSLTWC
ncbi:hypothetical protein BO71DRAFT_158338 [Aspergillus ellipticus CBS 707.79]|uniref:Uncharacterized protein n=1 Tax=Aspergillus ellipticus CBS 707.79 TaxID=1448320 RepID=A0A319CZV4_9EURO|nr:hypothetical protein BO71DRAFT_158338 [Aspergillus ellipticus CBS 707.79]